MRTLLIVIIAFLGGRGFAQDSSLVDYNGFLKLSTQVESYRLERLINITTFNEYSQEAATIILDTRSKQAFDEIHIAGAIHLNFSDFTATKLAAVIPSKETRILIYCNNNIISDLSAMMHKFKPLALNIPTFINLYGYGYKNIYELRDLLNTNDQRLKFEGSKVD